MILSVGGYSLCDVFVSSSLDLDYLTALGTELSHSRLPKSTNVSVVRVVDRRTLHVEQAVWEERQRRFCAWGMGMGGSPYLVVIDIINVLNVPLSGCNRNPGKSMANSRGGMKGRQNVF